MPKAKETRNKKQVIRKKEKITAASLRALAKQSLKNQKAVGVNKIATSHVHETERGTRNDEKVKKSAVKAKTTLNLLVPVYSLAGNAVGTMSLPKEIFGVKVNTNLLAQAMRVYMNNQKGHFSNTKTRGEVEGSTRKIYAQKGTGRARHGSIRAPIFVGGGIALGPKSRKVILDLPKKMKKASLISALAQKMSEKQILGLSGLDKSSGKTSEMAKLFNKLEKKSILIIGDKNLDNTQRSVRNIQGLSFLSVDQINAYEIVKHQSLILTKEAVDKLQIRLISSKKGENNVT